MWTNINVLVRFLLTSIGAPRNQVLKLHGGSEAVLCSMARVFSGSASSFALYLVFISFRHFVHSLLSSSFPRSVAIGLYVVISAAARMRYLVLFVY